MSAMNCAGAQKGLLLTDGWYCIHAVLDPPLAALLGIGGLVPGTAHALCNKMDCAWT